jgi:hypothetical protein
MSGFMSTALSGMFSFLQFGVSLDWLRVWGESILIAWPVAASLDLMFGAHIRKLSASVSRRISVLDGKGGTTVIAERR